MEGSQAQPPLLPNHQPATGNRQRKALTIGAVCKALSREFPELSISKIRYLEEQQLLSPRRTPGGYRLYAAEDVERLRAILRMQRDEFLPLRVIRQELAAGRLGPEPTGPTTGQPPTSRAALSLADGATTLTPFDQVATQLGVEAKLVEQLVEFGLISPKRRDGIRYLDATEREIVRCCAELGRYGIEPRNLSYMRSAAQREAALLEQTLAPMLRARNPERRAQALQSLQELAAIAVRLKHLLLTAALKAG